MRSGILAFACFAAMLSSEACAQTDGPRTHEVAACQDASDQPICILRALTHERTHFPYAEDPDFAGAADVLVAIGPDDLASASDAAADLVVGPTRESRRALVAALVADQHGATPAAALAPIDAAVQGVPSRSFLGAEIVTQNGAQLRCNAYESIWSRYLAASEAPRRGHLPAPSAALARAAAEHCEHELPNLGSTDRFHLGPADVAGFYAAQKDEAAVERVMRLDRRGPAFGHVEARLMLADLDGAARALDAFQPSASSNRDVADLRMRVMRAAQDQHRQDLAARMAARILSDLWAGEDPEYANDFSEPARIFVAAAPTAEASALMSQLDAAGRNTLSARSLEAAVAAVAGWSALNQPQRAQALIDIWTPAARAEAGASGCGGHMHFCVRQMTGLMLRYANHLDQAWDLAGLRATDAVRYDIEDGIGLAHLDAYLAYAPADFDYEQALDDCVTQAALHHHLDWAETCVQRLIAHGGNRPLTAAEEDRLNSAFPTGIRGPYLAAAAALKLGSFAARAGDDAMAARMLQAALQIWRASPDNQVEMLVQFSLQEIAVAQLRAAGRM